MAAHTAPGDVMTVLAFDVQASDIYDLRLPEALATVRRHAGDPLMPWQAAVSRGNEPATWRARDWIEQAGAKGLIDPSRQAPGLWHLVLFSWNVPGGASVTMAAL